ncbi:MAG: GerAB/ArcD/ProY family transporter [Clostridia bacterium]|nr:GerAB/ArcD/ProY family transporter [Clostridia bacterium]
MDKVNLRQFLCITFLVAIAMKMFLLPVLMMRASGRDSFLAMIFALSADLLLMLVVIIALQLSGEKNVFELLKNAFGSIVSRILLLLVSAFYTFKLFVVLADVRMFFSTSVYSSTMSPIHLLPFIALLVYFAFKPFSASGRLTEIITPLVVVSMLLLCFMTLPEVDFTNILPIAGEGLDKAVNGTYPFALWFGDFTVLLALCGKVKGGGGKLYFGLISAFVGFAFMLLFSTTLFSAYGDMTEVLTYGHNISNMTQYGAGSYKFGRIDLIIYTLWLSAVVLSAGIMTLFICRSTEYTLSSKIGKWVTLGVGVLLFIMSIIFSEMNRVTEFMTTVMWLPAVITQYCFPIICLIAGIINKFKERRKCYDKAEQKA